LGKKESKFYHKITLVYRKEKSILKKDLRFWKVSGNIKKSLEELAVPLGFGKSFQTRKVRNES